jgi:glycosyltransferase involved in cell wall biosynthesis
VAHASTDDTESAAGERFSLARVVRSERSLGITRGSNLERSRATLVKICLDLSAAVHGRAGVGRYSQRLAEALSALGDDEYSVFYNRPDDAQIAPPLDRLPRIPLPLGDKPWRARVALAHLAHRSQDRLLGGADLFHALDHLLPHLVRTPSVFTLYDLTYRVRPATHNTLNRVYLTLLMPTFLRRAGAVIAISESTRRDALRVYGLDPAQVTVVYGGVDPNFCPASPDARAAIRRKYALAERFILSVGTIEPRKNLISLLDAYHTLRQSDPELGLVIAGRRGWRCANFFERLQALGLTDEVRLLGPVPDVDLPALYGAAAVFAYPSLYEGFGLPPLEAMACGTPVVASNTSSLPEVIDDAGLLVAPHDIGGLAASIRTALTDTALCADLRARGLTQARRFTWDAAARATLQVYQAVLSHGSVP